MTTSEAKHPMFTERPHPWYGPCDGFGEGREWCSECRRVMLEMESALVGLFWMQIGAVAALALWLDYIDFHCATTWDAPTTLPEEVNGWTDDLRRILAHGSPVWRLEATSDA